MAYTKYSLTPANNNAAPPDGAPEGMLPSAVNDTMRDMMAQIRDCGDGIRGGTYTMTAPVITGGSVNGAAIGASSASTGAFTTLSASSTVSGTGFSNYFASPPALGGTAAAAVSSTNLSYTGTLTGGTGVVNLGSGQFYKDASGNVGIGTSSPNSALEVNKNITFVNADTFAQLIIKTTAGATGKLLNIGVDEASNISFIQSVNRGTAVNDLVLQRYGGNVGIGTSSPASFSSLARNLVVNGTTNAGITISESTGGGTASLLFAATSAFPNKANITNDFASGSLQFGLNATERMRIDSAGNVGIGTSSPFSAAGWKALSIDGTTYGLLELRSAGTSYGQIYSTSNLLTVNANGASSVLALQTNSTERMRIDSAGNVGIGTSSPSAKLDISINNTNVGNGSSLQLEQAGTGDAAISFLIGATTEWLAGVDNSDGDKFKISNITGGADFTTLGMAIDSSGNVGIGTSSPAVKVEIGGTGVLRLTNASGDAQLQLKASGTNPNYISYNLGGAGAMAFYDSNAGAERMRIDASGNLLVGTTTATARFNVYGESGSNAWLIHSTALVTTPTGHHVFSNPNGVIGSIATSASITLYNTTSDYRLKTVIAPVSDSGTRLDALQPIEYDWKAGGRTRGFLAHQFAEVYPSSVSGEKDAVDAEGKPVYQGMQASTPEVMADLIAEIQSLRKRVAQLESK